MGSGPDVEAAGLAAQQLVDGTAWLLGPEGRERAERTLTRRGLPHSSMDVDDLCSAALLRLTVRFGNGPIELTHGDESVRAYATTVLRSLTTRLVDGGARQRLRELVDWSEEVAPAVESDDDRIDDEVAAGDAVDSVRRRALDAIDGRVQAWTVAAGLATVTIAAGEVQVMDGIRVPAHEADVARWAGLA